MVHLGRVMSPAEKKLVYLFGSCVFVIVVIVVGMINGRMFQYSNEWILVGRRMNCKKIGHGNRDL